MNKSYRTVWNASTGTWTAAAETARACGKSKTNSTMRSSVTAAVAVMAGVGGTAVSFDAMAQTANGNGLLNLCGGANTAAGTSYGYSGSAKVDCTTVNKTGPVYQGHTPSFILGNSSTANGSGNGSPAMTASVVGSADGHLMLYGANGVHFTGVTDFANTVSMTNNRIQNLAAGTAGTDAVNLNQLNAAIAASADNPYVKVNSGMAAAVASGTEAIAIGASARSSAENTTAVGYNSSASAGSATALGAGASAGGAGSMALGVRAQTTSAATNATAVGPAATAFGQNTLAVGYNANVGTAATNSVAMGPVASVVANATNALALGSNARVANSSSTAIGADSSAAGGFSVALGRLATANNSSSISIGSNSTASADYSVALGGATQSGRGAIATGSRAVAIGTLSSAGATNSVALGYGTVADRANTVSVGAAVGNVDGSTFTRQIVNVAAGTQDDDAVNLGQMNTALSTKLDTTYAKINAGIGTAASAATAGDIALGQSAVASSPYNGGGDHAATAVGWAAQAVGARTAAFGMRANASADDALAMGYNARATTAGSVALGQGSVANRGNAVSVGSSTLQRQITNVAAGTQNTDAVNVGQLSGVTKALGGGAAVGSDGSITNPTYKVGGTDYHNVGDALDALASSGIADPNAVTYDDATKGTVTLGGVGAKTPVAVKNVADAKDDHDALNLGQLKNAGLVGDDGAGNLTSLAVTYDGATKDSVTLGGTGATTPVALHNVADGVLSATSKDAVNGSQLFATNQDLGNLKDSLEKGGAIDPTTGESLAVVYDSTAKDKVTLKGADGTTLSNVKAGVADMDAVNVSQLKDSGLIGDDGKSIAAVTYDRNADGTPNYGTVTLGNGAGPTQIKNVATGVDDLDAVNVKQLNTGLSDLRDEMSGGNLRFVKVNADLVTGTPAVASGALAVAIGSDARATSANSLALGSGARVTGAGSVAIGYNSVANQNNVVSVGDVGRERKIVNVADGDVAFQSTDAVNGGQLYAALNNLSTSVTSKTQQAIDTFSSEIDKKTQAAIDEVNSRSMQPMDVSDPLVAIEGLQGNNVASLNGADPTKATAAAIGSSTAASGANAVAVGLQSGAGSNNSVAIGSFAQTGAGQDYSVAVGSNVQTNGTQAVSLGANAQANGDYALAVGNNGAQAIGDGSIAVGNAANVRAGSTNAIAIGTGANVARSVASAMALGANATAGAANSIALGADSFSNRANALSVGRAGAERQIVNVAAGTQATDAVNVSQLKGVTDSLGGGTAIGADGSITKPTYKVDGSDYHNVGDALDALASRSAGDPNAVAYDSVTKDTVTLGGAGATTPVALKNVADAKDDHDALNLGQLKNAGLVGEDASGNLTSAAVTYDRNADGTISHDKATLAGTNGTTLSNVKAGVADMDAVNVSQLKDAGLIDPSTGKSIAAVTYDRNADGTPNYGSVSLGNGVDPTQIKNVADAKDDGDALNLGQLKNAGLVGEDASGNLTSAAVTYDRNADGTVNHDKATLAGTTGTTLSNVKAGVADMDAVNVSQLKGSGLIGDDGKSIAAVTYDRNADGTPNYGSVSLGNAGTPVGIHNVAAGTVSATSNDAINGSQLFTVSKSVADKIGGGAGVGADGSITDPTYSVGGQDYHSVGDALGALDKNSSGNPLAVAYDSAAKDTITLGGTGATTPVALKNVADAKDDHDALNLGQLKNAGLVGDDGAGNLTSAAMTYDRNADGTINHDKATLAGTNGTTLSNVKAGVADMDAVNVSQLKDAGLIDPSTGKSIAAVTYDGAAKDSVTLGGAGATTPVALKNVADGTDRHDAINLGQLQDAGLVAPVDPTDPSKGLTSLAVTYDGAAKDKVTLAGTNGTTLSNVKAGVDDMDAVNVSQLKDAGLIDPSTGKPIAAVTYDSAAKDSVTLGGAGATTPVALKNVADAKDDGDALNLGQLKNAGLVGDDGAGNLTSAAMTYDKNADGTINHDKATLAGTDGTTLSNVKAGVADMDAVNVSQLKDAGLIDPSTGKSIAAVTYDSTAKDTVTLGGAGATTPVALKNVADGTERHDAINLGQLQDAGLVGQDGSGNLTSLAVAYDSTTRDVVTLKGANGTTITNVKAGAVTATSTDAINGAQLHATAQSVADSLGGGSTVGADGKVTNPTYSLADPTDATKSKDYSNVGDALSNLDGRTAMNTKNITVINKQLADSGLVDPVTGQAIAAVTYDRNADGTPNLGSVTLGGAGATAPVALKNVADGVDSHDAVNLGQLQNAGLVAPVDPTNPGAGLTSLAVTYDKHADGSANFDQITMKGANGTTITNVKAGAVSATSTDAINGAQLHGVSQSVAKSLGGGATVDADGNVTNPTYKVSDKTFDNVGDAIENISSSLVHGSIGLVQQDDVTRDITVAKDTDGTTVNFAGTAGDRVLTGVGAGAVSATSNDAINGAQLHGTAQSVADVIGGGTIVDADGKLADTSIEVNGNKYKTVAEAVQAAAQYGATDSLAVRYDLNADGTPNYGSVTLGGTGAAPVRLTNVADGASKYDAVNFGQLSELSDRIGGIDDRVGALEQNPGNPNPGPGGPGNDYFAGTDVGSDGTTAANAGTGTGNTAAGSGAIVGTGANNATVIGSNANVSQSNGTAIGSGSKSTAEGATSIGSNANASGSKSTAIGEGANASGSNAVALGAGSVATEANTVSFGNGTDDGNRRITNIRDGINETDAATKGQLDRAMGGLQGQVNDLSRNAYSGIAAATALTMIPGVDPNKTLSFGIGGATYRGYQAVAFGGEARITQNLKMKAGVGLSSGGNTVGVGASYQW
ncbi:TPA: YadA-like family protein [Burkholderia cenocepacia]